MRLIGPQVNNESERPPLLVAATMLGEGTMEVCAFLATPLDAFQPKRM